MTICEYCKSEPNLVFICPHCGNRHCKEHRKPENHECLSLPDEFINARARADLVTVDESIIDQEIKSEPIISFETKSKTEFNTVEEFLTEDDKISSINEEESIISETNNESITSNKLTLSSIYSIIPRGGLIIFMLIVGVIFGTMLGTLINPSEYDENLQQRYDQIYEYYVNAQAHNMELNIVIFEMTSELASMEIQLNQITIEYNQLFEQYLSLQLE
jgi:hypothetical protein